MAQIQELPEQLPSAPTTPQRPWGKLTPNRLWSSLQTGSAWYRQTTHRLTDRWHSWQDNRQGRTEAQAWLASLAWYRLRYGSAELAQQGLLVLAGATGCGRVACSKETGNQPARLNNPAPKTINFAGIRVKFEASI